MNTVTIHRNATNPLHWDTIKHKQTGINIRYSKQLNIACLVNPWSVPLESSPENAKIPRSLFTQIDNFITRYEFDGDDAYYYAVKAYLESVKSRLDYYGEIDRKNAIDKTEKV